MNTAQIKKHGEIIKWLIDNPEKNLWQNNGNGWVESTEDISFNIGMKYVQNDEYAELRKLVIDKPDIELQVSYNNGINWHPKTAVKAFLTTGENKLLRVKPNKPQFKIGDWLHDTTNNNIFLCEELDSNGYPVTTKPYSPNIGCKTSHDYGIELWEPQEGDLVVYQTNERNWEVTPYVLFLMPRLGAMPLEFIQTLRTSNGST